MYLLYMSMFVWQGLFFMKNVFFSIIICKCKGDEKVDIVQRPPLTFSSFFLSGDEKSTSTPTQLLGKRTAHSRSIMEMT